MADRHHIIKFHAALNGSKMADYKPVILESYGVDSSKKLTNRQVDEVVERLNGLQKSKSPKKEVPQAVRRNRSLVLDLLTRLGVYNDNRDWSLVNAYLLDKRICGKYLYELDLTELKALQRKLRGILKKREEQLSSELESITTETND